MKTPFLSELPPSGHGRVPVRDLSVLGASYFPTLIGFWMLSTLTTLLLAKRGTDAAVIGVFAAMPWFAVLFAGPLVPRLIKTAGWHGAYWLGNACALGAVAGFAFSDSLPAWFAWSFLSGVSLNIRWIVADSWAAVITPAGAQGRMVGAFETLAGISIGIGPALLVVTGTSGTAPFATIAALVVFSMLGILPLRPPRIVAPEDEDETRIRFGGAAMFLVLIAVIAGGLLESGASGLLPVFGLERGLGPDAATLLVTTANAFALVLQWPLGWLADRYGPVLVLRGSALALLIASIALALAPGTIALFAAVFIWGGIAGTFYTLGRIIAGRKYPAAIVPVMSLVALLYTVGAITGPVASGFALSRLGPAGFLWAIVGAALVLAILVRMRRPADK